jgi:excisionase family DNA binding protein
MEKWLKIKEVAEIAGVSISTVRRWLKADLTSRKFGRLVRIREGVLEEYLNNSCISKDLRVKEDVDKSLGFS